MKSILLMLLKHVGACVLGVALFYLTAKMATYGLEAESKWKEFFFIYPLFLMMSLSGVGLIALFKSGDNY